MGERYSFCLALAWTTALIATPAAAQSPQPGKLESYKDWTIGCDNLGRCEAVSLMPEGGEWPDNQLAMGVARDAGPAAGAQLWVSWGGKGREAVSFLVDGRRLALADGDGGEVSLKGARAARLAVAMARGRTLELKSGGKLLGKPSLAGLAAALRYMDARQGRAGTTDALVAAGALGASAVRAAPPPVRIRRAAIPSGPAPAPLWREELAALGAFTKCADDMRDASPPELHRLSKSETLILVPCGAGAYNYSSVPVIATGIAGRRSFRLASFDYPPGWSGDPRQPTLVNAGWSAESATLQSYAKGRGIGDCGGGESYVWDGARFRLSEATAMGECRGSWRWIRTWSAQVVD